MAAEIPEDLVVDVPCLRNEEKFHVFIAHSSDDVEFSYQIADGLNKLGFKCFHADYDFQPGVTIIANIEEGISRSRRVVVLISENFIRSMWFTFEMASSLSKSYERQERVMIPVLYNIDPHRVPSYIREINYVQSSDQDFWKKLVRAVTEIIPISAAIPSPNVAHGLVWSYYYGYLSIILPGIIDRIQESQYNTSAATFIKKLFIVLPESCYCPQDISDIDKNVTYVGLLPFKARRAGNVERDFPSSVYRVTDQHNQTDYLILLEFAAPLMSIFEMEQGAMSGLSPEDKLVQMKVFKEKLTDILNHMCNAECHNKVVIIEYKDLEPDNPILLSNLLLRAIKHQLDISETLRKLTLDVGP